ncbi:GNAT family N-acetyltransferase [Cytobacillus purgationiresistens]|uniref:N-acetyltransferase domain-containing protein n=1 Tax=Cytobacillus purgationiresistens TaxID=863449 RepID=A0ABU0AJM1_9BACI|nr:Clp protease N-terminal domain-containing protein [Cytobacillus purgationiresistens]MDQ0271463.1 hypothetical protein [Cytobacillus purgationiresistens]
MKTALLTDRLKRIFNCAEREAIVTESEAVSPEHLLLAFLQERTGVYNEIFQRSQINITSLRASSIKEDQKICTHELFSISITADVLVIYEAAHQIMQNYNQVILNEGHLLKAMLNIKSINELLTEEQKNLLLQLGTTSRDMIVSLEPYFFPLFQTVSIRRVQKEDYEKLVQFVEGAFSFEWARTVEIGLAQQPPPIYIALGAKQDIIGFAAYDSYKGYKGYFGPMGVVHDSRMRRIGYELLHHCLNDMKEIGYAYAIIGEAGPIEFYEKACSAVVIPMKGD